MCIYSYACGLKCVNSHHGCTFDITYRDSSTMIVNSFKVCIIYVAYYNYILLYIHCVYTCAYLILN